jgi:hypothetical protein
MMKLAATSTDSGASPAFMARQVDRQDVPAMVRQRAFAKPTLCGR